MNSRLAEKLVFQLLRVITYSIVLVVALIIADIVIKGLPVMSWEFLSSAPRNSGTAGGILPAIVGTLYLVSGTIVVALPLGMGAALWLTEYATQGRLTRLIRLAIVTLAGVPSIVFGLFGYGLFVNLFGLQKSIIAGSLTLACMILPTIIVASEEALRAVPQSLRQGSLALGATQWQTIWKNVLPYAIPGMITGSILGIGRAAGETAPIVFTAAASFKFFLPHTVFEDVMALPFHVYYLATQVHDMEKAAPYQNGTAFVLLALVLAINLAAILLRSRFRKRYRW